MELSMIFTLFMIVVRVITLSGEQVAIHGLGEGQSGVSGAFTTMGVAFWGATFILWMIALEHGQAVWVGETIFTGAIYAIAFGLYTAALSIEPVGKVSPWTNATIIMLWLVQPTGQWLSVLGIFVFSLGSWLLLSRTLSYAAIMMIVSDIFLVCARLCDSSHTDIPVYAYSASLFASISLWMSIPILSTGCLPAIFRLIKNRPGWSMVASSTNALSYVTLFILLHWLPPALVEAISAISGFTATLAGIFLFHEPQATRKVWASGLMTLSVLMLIFDHFKTT